MVSLLFRIFPSAVQHMKSLNNSQGLCVKVSLCWNGTWHFKHRVTIFYSLLWGVGNTCLWSMANWSVSHLGRISHFKLSYSGRMAKSHELSTMPRNNAESFTIFSSVFLSFLPFKNLDWHTESYRVTDSNKLLNLFLRQYHESGRKKDLRNLIEIVTCFIEERNFLVFCCLIMACMALYLQ